MKGILYLPNKREITNTNHSYDIIFKRGGVTSIQLLKYLPVCKKLRNSSSMCVEEFIFNVKIVNYSRSAGNFNKSVFWIRTQGKEPFFHM